LIRSEIDKMNKCLVLLVYLESVGVRNVRQYCTDAVFSEDLIESDEVLVMNRLFGQPEPLYGGAMGGYDVKWETPHGKVIYRSRNRTVRPQALDALRDHGVECTYGKERTRPVRHRT